MSRARTRWLAAGAMLVVLVPIVPLIAGAQEVDGFDGYVQSGTCAAPTRDLRVELDGDGDHDIEPYEARTGTDDDTVVLGYYGSPGAPGFGFSAIYTDRDFSLVITGAGDGDPVACGDMLEPDADRFGEAGIAVVQLLPVGDSAVQGIAVVDRATLQRELVITPTRVRVLLSSGGEVTTPPDSVEGFDGYIQGGTCESPGNRLRLQLKGRGDHDVEPFLAKRGGDEAVTVAYYGSTGAPGFGFAATFTDQVFSLVLTDTENADPVTCGDILEPDDDDFADAGLALVQMLPVGDSGAQGFALIERIPLQRELDVTPTRVRILLFAPPVTTT